MNLRTPLLLALTVALSSVAGPTAPTTPPLHHPHDVCSVVALPPNFPDDPTVFTASHGSINLFLRSRNRGYGWRNIRSGMRGHTVTDCEIAPDWAASKLMFVALGKDGLQRSTTGGDVWEPPMLTETITQVEAAELVDGARSVVCGGDNSIYYSSDSGDNWALIGTTPRPLVTLAIPDSFAAQPFIAVGTSGNEVYVRDGVEEWKAASIPSPAHTIEFSPAFTEDRTIWVGTYGHGLLRSVDAGATFRRVRNLVPREINDIVLAPTWPACRDVFVATPNDGVHASRDGGTTWERMPLHVVETMQTENHYQTLAISANYPEDPTVYCGAFEGLYCTTNAGENWFELNLNPTRIGRKVAISPQYARDRHVFLAGYGNPIAVTSDGGDSWDFRSRGARTMGAYSIAASPSFARDKLVMLGVGRGIRRSTDGGGSWESINLPKMSPSLKIKTYEIRQIQFSPDFTTDQSAFAVSAGGFYHSKDAGKTWQGHQIPTDFIWRMAVAPDFASTKTVFLGGHSVWRSDNGGGDWQRLAVTGKVWGITCTPDFAETGEVYLVSRERGLLRSVDRGKTWTPIEGAFEGFSPTKIRLSSTFLDDRTIFVSTVSGGMFRSSDRGESWERCAPLGSRADSAFDFVLSPALSTDKTLFACTFDGLVKSTDLGLTWKLTTDVEIYDDARDPWIFRGSWTRSWRNRSFGSGVHRARAEGREANLAFTGTGVKILGGKGPDHGMCEILIDGTKVADVNCFAESWNLEQVLYEKSGLEQGFHDIRVRVLGTADPRATNSWVTIDAAITTYTSEDDNNRQLARLENIYLTPDASYARDTRSQNPDIAALQRSLQQPNNAGPTQHTLETSDRELRDLLRSMRTQLDHMTEDMKVLRERIKNLDQAIHAREKKRGK